MDMTRVYQHLVAFSDIARPRQHSRSVINGYNASATYIYKTLLKETDYDVELQPFEVDLFSNVVEPTLKIDERVYQSGVDFTTIHNSGSGNVVDQLVLVIKGGCYAKDYRHVEGGEILLLSREGDCDYKSMLELAAETNASAILLYTSLPVSGPVTAACKKPMNIPILGLSHAAAIDVLERTASRAKQTSIVASLSANTKLEKIITVNIIASTPQGDDSKVIISGSHLDSVPEGPGINDDGSGAAATLEVALGFYRSGLSKQTRQKVKFAFWSGEELGLLGSQFYVRNLAAHNQTALRSIQLNLNNDMLASPNFIRGVYNGYEADNESLRIPSGILQDLFNRWFTYRQLPTVPTEFNGRSDYGEFLNHGIPAGGLFTGAEKVKTEKEAELFGGFVAVPYDPCYHRSCDTLRNVQGPGLQVLKENVEAMAFIIQRLAFEEDIVGLLSGEKALGDPSLLD